MTYDDAFMDGYYSAMEEWKDGRISDRTLTGVSTGIIYAADTAGNLAKAGAKYAVARYGGAALYKAMAKRNESKKSTLNKIINKIVMVFNKIKLWIYERIPKFIKKFAVNGYTEKNDPILKELKRKTMDLTQKANAFGDGIGKKLMRNNIATQVALTAELARMNISCNNPGAALSANNATWLINCGAQLHNIINTLDTVIDFTHGIKYASA